MIADFSKKQKGEFSRNEVLLKLCGVVFLCISVFLIFENIKLYEKKRQLLAQINSYNQQIQSIQASSAQLKESIANADNPDYIEKVAREQDDMQKPGEKVVSFIMPQQSPVVSQQAKPGVWSDAFWQAALSNVWQAIKNIF